MTEYDPEGLLQLFEVPPDSRLRGNDGWAVRAMLHTLEAHTYFGTGSAEVASNLQASR